MHAHTRRHTHVTRHSESVLARTTCLTVPLTRLLLNFGFRAYIFQQQGYDQCSRGLITAGRKYPRNWLCRSFFRR